MRYVLQMSVLGASASVLPVLEFTINAIITIIVTITITIIIIVISSLSSS